MKSLVSFIKESLIKSYDHQKLIDKLQARYGSKIKEFNTLQSSSKVKSFAFSFDKQYEDDIAYDEGLYKILEFFGYYVSEFKSVDNENVYMLSIEPIFGEKCTDFVKKDCGGIVYHCTSEHTFKSAISKKGLIPKEGSTYRQFSERTFLFCGKNKKDILENAKKIIDQLAKKDYAILKIDVSKYNIDFYKDPYQNESDNNFIYANAVFHPSRITNIGKLEDLDKSLVNIDENKTISTPSGKKIHCQIIK